MDLRSHYPYWLLKNGLMYVYPSVQENMKCDVAIIGAGISGALAAWELTKAGYEIVIVDKRHAGMGSTAASTALLQYEIDTPLYELIEKVGYENAVKSYKLCRQAIYDLKEICDQFYDRSGFGLNPSLQFASYKMHVKDLQREYKLRKEEGFKIDFLGETDVKKKFSFSAPAAILSEDGGRMDTYAATHMLLQKSIQLGLCAYDNTEVTEIVHHPNGVKLQTSTGYAIKARYLVIACGYESQKYLPKKVETFHSTFAIISEPIPEKFVWFRNALIWETSSPYLYLRTTTDHRIIIGGKDIESSDPEKRDQLIPKKTADLEKSFKKMFPHIPFKTDFKWAGVFASTKDGLPFIGSVPDRPHTFFSLGFGGNGVVFSVIAAQMIRDIILGKKNPDASIFGFDR